MKLDQLEVSIDTRRLTKRISNILPALAEFCTERGFLLHTEAVHNVVRTTYETENVEIEGADLDAIARYVSDLKKRIKCVRFYTDYYKFYRSGGFTKKLTSNWQNARRLCGYWLKNHRFRRSTGNGEPPGFGWSPVEFF